MNKHNEWGDEHKKDSIQRSHSSFTKTVSLFQTILCCVMVQTLAGIQKYNFVDGEENEYILDSSGESAVWKKGLADFEQMNVWQSELKQGLSFSLFS